MLTRKKGNGPRAVLGQDPELVLTGEYRARGDLLVPMKDVDPVPRRWTSTRCPIKRTGTEYRFVARLTQ
jgi:hypothetical protein